MKPFALAVAAVVLIAFAASSVLNSSFQKTAEQAFATSGARLGPAH